MMPAVLRQSGPKFMKDGKLTTPRALIQICEVCGIEGAPYGTTDEHGKRFYWCSDHRPEQPQKGAEG